MEAHAAPPQWLRLAARTPGTETPNDGTHSLGQTFAIDLVFEPAEGVRATFGRGRTFRPPSDFPAVGQELRAPVSGRVVSVQIPMRDHRSRCDATAGGQLAAAAAASSDDRNATAKGWSRSGV